HQRRVRPLCAGDQARRSQGPVAMPSLSLHNPDSGCRCEIELGRGFTYAVEADSPGGLEHLLEQMLHHPGTRVADGGVGTISTFTVRENVGLPPISHRAAPFFTLERAALDVLAGCGLDQRQAEALCRRRPAELGPFEKRLVGFVRGLLMDP